MECCSDTLERMEQFGDRLFCQRIGDLFCWSGSYASAKKDSDIAGGSVFRIFDYICAYFRNNSVYQNRQCEFSI